MFDIFGKRRELELRVAVLEKNVEQLQRQSRALRNGQVAITAAVTKMPGGPMAMKQVKAAGR